MYSKSTLLSEHFAVCLNNKCISTLALSLGALMINKLHVLSSPEDTLIDFIESGSGEERNIEARGKH